jgi:predicted component of type VI protein secretion system
MSTSNRLSPAYSGRFPKKLRGRAAKSTAEAAVNSVRRNTEELFESQPLCGADNGAGAATGTTGDVNVMLTGKNAFEYHVKGTQTLVAPSFSSSGLDISLDQTDNDGVELTQGISSRSKHAFTVGTSQPFFVECQFSIADVSGTDDCAVGFRKAEAYQANIDDYDEMAVLNVISGDIKIEKILNNAATTTVDTTQNWADAETHTLRIEVGLDGKCRFMVDGADATVSSAHTFDSGEVVVPFFFFLHSADVAGAVALKSWKCGQI